MDDTQKRAGDFNAEARIAKLERLRQLFTWHLLTLEQEHVSVAGRPDITLSHEVAMRSRRASRARLATRGANEDRVPPGHH